MAGTPANDPVETVARRFLNNDFLIERAARVAALTDWICGFTEVRELACNRHAVQAAAWFQDAWSCAGIQAGQFTAPLVLTMQPTDLQRRLAADLAGEQLHGVVDPPTRFAALRAIREAGTRGTVAAEAIVLTEATNLDSIGLLWLCGQVARCASENAPFATAMAFWERQIDYRYWPRRIEETLRFARSRELAKHRCAALDTCMTAFRDQLTCGDRHVAP